MQAKKREKFSLFLQTTEYQFDIFGFKVIVKTITCCFLKKHYICPINN